MRLWHITISENCSSNGKYEIFIYQFKGCLEEKNKKKKNERIQEMRQNEIQ